MAGVVYQCLNLDYEETNPGIIKTQEIEKKRDQLRLRVNIYNYAWITRFTNPHFIKTSQAGIKQIRTTYRIYEFTGSKIAKPFGNRIETTTHRIVYQIRDVHH